MASNSRSRPSPVGASSLAKKLSTSARMRRASASSSCASPSIVSTGIEGLQPRRLAVAPERDLLDPRLRVLEPGLAVAPQPVTFLVEGDRLVERRLTLFERAHDLFEAGKRRLETQFADVGRFGICHSRNCGPHTGSNQASAYLAGVFLNGSRMPGKISSLSASSSAPASAASASRA